MYDANRSTAALDTGDASSDEATRTRTDRDETRMMRSEDRIQMDRTIVADGLPLERLYARFDAIANGRHQGDSSAAHGSIIERLAANQRRAEALGWSGFVLERVGGSGRLELRGVRNIGRSAELVPDAIPYEMPPEQEQLSMPSAHHEDL